MTVILTVEDEFLVREYLGQVLSAEGYDVIGTANADEAIAVLETRNDIAIVITDIKMPGSMDGLKLAAAVRGRWPPIKIIITSADGKPSEDHMPAHSRFIPKPHRSAQVLTAVRHFM